MAEIIVVHADDYTDYLDASTDEAWARNAYGLLKERFQSGYFYHDPGDEPIYDGMSVAEIGEITDPEIKKIATTKYNRWVRAKREWQDEKATYDAVAEEVANGPTWREYKSGRREPTAWGLLDARSDYEYERVELMTVRNYD
jgi:hypothetical protein